MKLAQQMTVLVLALVLFGLNHANGQSLGTAFTYQGRLTDDGQSASGNYVMKFFLFDAETGGSQIGSDITQNVSVIGGLFSIDLDFGPGVFNDNDEPEQQWLEIYVDDQQLEPRQALNGTPYSIQTRGLRVREDGGGQTTSVGSQLSGFINGFEKFNVLVEDSDPYSGMAVHTESGSDPAYHYYSGNTLTARHYLDASESAWRLSVGDDRIYVDSTGFVGINKDTPVVGSEVFGVYKPTTGGVGIIAHADDFGDPYFGYATGDELRSYLSYDDDDEQFKIFFRELNGSYSSKVYVNKAGNMGIGVSNPNHQLQLSLNSAAKPTSSAWTVFSDRRLKTDIQNLDGALEQLMQLRGVTYRWKDPASQGGMDSTYPGFIAQEVEPVFPDWIDDDSNGYKKLTVIGFEALAVEALRELRQEKDKQVANLESENDELQNENEELRERMEVLEAQMQELLASSSSK